MSLFRAPLFPLLFLAPFLRPFFFVQIGFFSTLPGFLPPVRRGRHPFSSFPPNFFSPLFFFFFFFFFSATDVLNLFCSLLRAVMLFPLFFVSSPPPGFLPACFLDPFFPGAPPTLLGSALFFASFLHSFSCYFLFHGFGNFPDFKFYPPTSPKPLFLPFPPFYSLFFLCATPSFTLLYFSPWFPGPNDVFLGSGPFL